MPGWTGQALPQRRPVQRFLTIREIRVIRGQIPTDQSLLTTDCTDDADTELFSHAKAPIRRFGALVRGESDRQPRFACSAPSREPMPGLEVVFINHLSREGAKARREGAELTGDVRRPPSLVPWCHGGEIILRAEEDEPPRHHEESSLRITSERLKEDVWRM